jgi:hypothetical protein
MPVPIALLLLALSLALILAAIFNRPTDGREIPPAKTKIGRFIEFVAGGAMAWYVLAHLGPASNPPAVATTPPTSAPVAAPASTPAPGTTLFVGSAEKLPTYTLHGRTIVRASVWQGAKYVQITGCGGGGGGAGAQQAGPGPGYTLAASGGGGAGTRLAELPYGPLSEKTEVELVLSGDGKGGCGGGTANCQATDGHAGVSVSLKNALLGDLTFVGGDGGHTGVMNSHVGAGGAREVPGGHGALGGGEQATPGGKTAKFEGGSIGDPDTSRGAGGTQGGGGGASDLANGGKGGRAGAGQANQYALDGRPGSVGDGDGYCAGGGGGGGSPGGDHAGGAGGDGGGPYLKIVAAGASPPAGQQ